MVISDQKAPSKEYVASFDLTIAFLELCTITKRDTYVRTLAIRGATYVAI